MVLHWRKRALWADLARVACALIFCVFGALSMEWFSIGQVLLGGLSIVFGWYLLACMVKFVSAVTIDENGVGVSRKWLPALRVSWETVEGVEVRHFSLGQFRSRGLMDIKLKGKETIILIDDGVDRFPELLQLIWTLTTRNRIELSETSKTNLIAAGCSSPSDR